jgi:Lanthionine synthetase C-like protein
MLWRPDEHEPLIEREWRAAAAADAIGAIVSDACAAAEDGLWPGHPLDDVLTPLCTMYIGSAGMIWGLARLGAPFDGAAAVVSALARYRAAPDFAAEGLAHPPSLWMGETGLLVVADVIHSAAADRGRLAELVRANRSHPTWELMWGSPGTILAARTCGLEEEARESAELLYAQWDESSDMWTQDLYGNMQVYLGPAHGFAGNVHALRGFVDEDELRTRVTRAMSRTAAVEDGVVNWPPLDQPPSDATATIRVQWCHGAPGLITTLGDLMPLDLAVGGGELTWQAGPLCKGPGLCHGTAGNGFAFLRLYELTGEALWLERARRFAMHAIEQVHRELTEYGRGRYTLWTGHLGVALYLRACLEASAAFPGFDAL